MGGSRRGSTAVESPPQASSSSAASSSERGRATSASIAPGGDSTRSRNIKVVTLPAWAKSLHDDDALFDDPSAAPTTTKASRKPTGTDSSVSPLLQAPARTADPRRTIRQADSQRAASSEDQPQRPEPRHSHSFGWPHMNHHQPRPIGSRRNSSEPHQGTDLQSSVNPPNTGSGWLPMTRGNSRRQDSQGGGAEPVGDWWQFTLPVRYRKKVEDYMRSMSGTTTARSGGDVEKQQDPEKAVNGSTEESNTMRARIPNGTYTVHQTNTPGWSSPWQPFFLNRSGQNSQNPSGDPWSELDRPDINRINSIGRTESRNQTLWDKFSTFLLLHPAAPLVFRVLNLAFTAATLGLAARIIEIERTSQFDDTSLEGVVGTSTIYSIVVAPLTLVHIAIAVYAEYFGPPLGIWRVSRKMIFTLVELVFIALWSAGLALSFDDLFTTPLECTAYTPNALFRGDPLPPSEISPATSAHLCDLQAALVAMVFVSVILYAAVLVVSLFRIFNKVSSKR